MKYSLAALTALATAVVAKPAFTNEAFVVQQGVPFEFKFSGCSDGCTIFLKNGPSKDLKTVDTIVADVDGPSFTWTPEGLPSDTYAFEITDSKGVSNWSPQFEYVGTGKAKVTKTTKTEEPTSETEAATSTESAEETTSTSAAETTTSAPATTITTITTAASTATASTTESAEETSTTAEATETETESPATTPTTVPDSSAMRSTSSLALIAGAAVAFVFLN